MDRQSVPLQLLIGGRTELKQRKGEEVIEGSVEGDAEKQEKKKTSR